jgi:hypothetical protein
VGTLCRSRTRNVAFAPDGLRAGQALHAKARAPAADCAAHSAPPQGSLFSVTGKDRICNHACTSAPYGAVRPRSTSRKPSRWRRALPNRVYKKFASSCFSCGSMLISLRLYCGSCAYERAGPDKSATHAALHALQRPRAPFLPPHDGTRTVTPWVLQTTLIPLPRARPPSDRTSGLPSR